MSTVNFKYENGDILRDKVSGLEGVVRVRAEYSTGCVHYGIQSQELKDGAPRSWVWLDQSELQLVLSGAVSFDINETPVSGPMPSGPQN